MNTYQRQKNEIERLRADVAEANRAAYTYLRIARNRRTRVVESIERASFACSVAWAVTIFNGIVCALCLAFAYYAGGAAR